MLSPTAAAATAFLCLASRVTIASTLATARTSSVVRSMAMAHNNNYATITAAAASSSSSSSLVTPAKVNLLDLAAAAVASTVSASRTIRRIANTDEESQHARLKDDGSVVTDADFAAQALIFKAVKSVCSDIRIVGEESEEDMASVVPPDNAQETNTLLSDDDIFQLARREMRQRYFGKEEGPLPLATSTAATKETLLTEPLSDLQNDELVVDASRVTLFVDPLDGTKSFVQKDYDCVSILIAIVLDNRPCFGVIGKPFGYTGIPVILDTNCVTIYGGDLLKGVYVAGGRAITDSPQDNEGELPRAVISGSRSKGVVHDFCVDLGARGLIHPEPMLISGAGEKALRLILRRGKEGLWFFPKVGTFLWDVASLDALMLTLGGRVSDKFGNGLDYSKSRENAENTDGLIACVDRKLHEECVKLFQEGDWLTRQ